MNFFPCQEMKSSPFEQNVAVAAHKKYIVLQSDAAIELMLPIVHLLFKL
jgi:hypothetical protein